MHVQLHSKALRCPQSFVDLLSGFQRPSDTATLRATNCEPLFYGPRYYLQGAAHVASVRKRVKPRLFLAGKFWIFQISAHQVDLFAVARNAGFGPHDADFGERLPARLQERLEVAAHEDLHYEKAC